MPYRNNFKTIAVSPDTHKILKERAIYRQTLEDVILELITIADKYDRVCHKGNYSKEKQDA